MSSLLRDGEEAPVASHGQQWMMSWHPAGDPPPGKPHGSAGLCVTNEGLVVLISEHPQLWELPAGRPEADEDWEQTLRREVLEEACAVVTQATLLGYSRGRCVGGTETGLVLVRSFWRADVDLAAWQPLHEIKERKAVSIAEARRLLPQALNPILDRAFSEAGLV